MCCALQAADRLLLITEALTSTGPSSFLAAGMGGSDPQDAAGSSTSDLHVHHVLLPAAYLAANWPLRYVAISPCGSDITAAGARGLVVYNRKQERWRMFGEVLQVQSRDRPPAQGVSPSAQSVGRETSSMHFSAHKTHFAKPFCMHTTTNPCLVCSKPAPLMMMLALCHCVCIYMCIILCLCMC